MLLAYSYFPGQTFFFFFAYNNKVGKNAPCAKITDCILIKLMNSHSNQEPSLSSLFFTLLLKVLWLFKSIVAFQ